MNGFEELRQLLLVFTFTLPRMLTAFALLPVLGKQMISGMVRSGVVMSLAIFVFPIVADTAPATELTWVVGIGVLLKEVFIGLLVGFSAAGVFWAIESAGFFIDNHRGATMASSIDPLTGSQTSPLGNLLTQALSVIFLVGGGFLLFLGALYESYQLWPVFSFFPHTHQDGAAHFLGLLDQIMGMAVLLAAPVILVMFMSEFALGLISRFAPQLNVFFLSMPVKSGVGILFLAIYAGIMLRYFNEQLRALPLQFKLLAGLFT